MKNITPPPTTASELPETDPFQDIRFTILKQMRVVVRAAQQHSAWIEKQCGVTGAQLWLMQELEEAGGLRVGELARRLAIHQTTTSNLLDSLVKRELVEKSRDPDDQRAVIVSLSAAGSALLVRAPKPARGLLPEALMHMTPQAMQQLSGGLQSLIDCIETADEEFAMLPLPFTM